MGSGGWNCSEHKSRVRKFKIILQIFNWTFAHISNSEKSLFPIFSQRRSRRMCIFCSHINKLLVNQKIYASNPFLLNWIGLKVWNLLPSKTKRNKKKEKRALKSTLAQFVQERKEEKFSFFTSPPLNLCFMGGADAVFPHRNPHEGSRKRKLNSQRWLQW